MGFAAELYSSIFQHQLLKEAGESWQALVEFAYILLKEFFVYFFYKFCVNFTFSTVSRFSFSIFSIYKHISKTYV